MYFRPNDITLCVIGENEEKCERDFSVEGSQRVSSRLTFFWGTKCVGVSLVYHILYFLGGIGWGGLE